MPQTIDALLSDCGLPRSEALLLLAHASGLTRAGLIVRSKEALAESARASFAALAERRSSGEPVAYLLGYREFYGRRFEVGPDVLIPRPETELLVDGALFRIDSTSGVEPMRVLDLGTGSGAIAVTIAAERPGVDVVASDRSSAALVLARRNAARLGSAVRFVQGDWFDAVPADDPGFDLVVSNPPYIAAGDRHLDEGDLRFEPAAALTDFEDGLAAIRRIVRDVRRHLRAGGNVMLEHGHDQAAAVRALLKDAGFARVGTVRDLAGIERVTSAR